MSDSEAVDPHFLALYAATTAMYELVDALPECDIVLQLNEILVTQCELLEHIFEDKHYGSDRLKCFVDYTNNLKYEMRKLQDAVEEGKE